MKYLIIILLGLFCGCASYPGYYPGYYQGFPIDYYTSGASTKQYIPGYVDAGGIWHAGYYAPISQCNNNDSLYNFETQRQLRNINDNLWWQNMQMEQQSYDNTMRIRRRSFQEQ